MWAYMLHFPARSTPPELQHPLTLVSVGGGGGRAPPAPPFPTPVITIYRRLLIGRDGHLDQSEAYDISELVREYGPCLVSLPFDIMFICLMLMIVLLLVWYFFNLTYIGLLHKGNLKVQNYSLNDIKSENQPTLHFIRWYFGALNLSCRLISVTYTVIHLHLSQVKHVGMKCIAQGHNI